jgi:hypothetical protein
LNINEKGKDQKYKEFHKFNSLPISKVINPRRRIWACHVAHMGEVKTLCKVLVRKLAGKRPLVEIYRYRWEADIKMDFEGIGCEGVD